MDKQRLLLEQKQMRVFPKLRTFALFEDDIYLRNSWKRYFWKGYGPTGHQIKVHYPDDYPYEAPKIIVSPDVNTHHKYGEDICYYKGNEWNANYTAATAAFIAFRFLNDYKKGRLD